MYMKLLMYIHVYVHKYMYRKGTTCNYTRT